MKKKTTKALLLSLCAILLVTASVLGTVAYLTSTAEVKNTFTVGNVAITLDEAPVDGNGKATTGTRVTANSYKLLPGHEYDKDPTVHVASTSEDCYLFVKVENEISAIEADTKIAAQMTTNGWALVEGQTNVYVYVGTGTNPAVVTASTDVKVFESFKIKDDIDNATLATYNDKTITVTAYAIQADGFEGKTASEIWAEGFVTTTD